jgi:hypothetical protein
MEKAKILRRLPSTASSGISEGINRLFHMKQLVYDILDRREAVAAVERFG